MKEVGFIKTSMPDEERVALLPKDLTEIVEKGALFFEKGYAKHLGVDDERYRESGANVVDRSIASSRDVLCLPKPWIDDVDLFQPGQTLMGWLYLPEKKEIARSVLKNEMTALAWENFYDPEKNYVFDKNRWYAGFVSTAQALQFARKAPENLKIGLLGRGRVAKGAMAWLDRVGATNYKMFGRDGYEEFMSELPSYDVAIIGWYYDVSMGNFLTLDDLQEMKDGALLIDVTSEGVEGSLPHPALQPVYEVGRFKKVRVYNNNHAPTMWPLEASQAISEAAAPYINKVMRGEPDPVLTRALSVDRGQIVDERIYTLLGIKIPDK